MQLIKQITSVCLSVCLYVYSFYTQFSNFEVKT